MMKIFITGGTGFIGTHLVKRLARTDHELVCLARETSDVGTLKEVGATIVVGDVTDKGSLSAGMQGCDWVANLANLFLLWARDEHVYAEVNIEGTRNVMESASETGITKVVHVSSAAVWGKTDWPISETTPMGVQRASKYAQTKYEGDQIAWNLYEERGLPLVMIYPAGVIGADDPKATGRYIKNLVQHRMPTQVLSEAPFSFVYVGDVCASILGALEKEGNIGEKYLVSCANLTFGELNGLVSDIAGVRLPKLRLPDAVTAFNARVLTGIASLTGRPPWLDLSVDQVSLMRQGFKVDGSKAERELGLHYTPIRQALEEAIASF
jgi:dihydroflavonol-4-reductase